MHLNGKKKFKLKIFTTFFLEILLEMNKLASLKSGLNVVLQDVKPPLLKHSK
jgi:hypothetical protein